jgi:hypothetical protein
MPNAHLNNIVKPILTDLYGENHGSDKPISRMSEGKGNVVIDMKKEVEDKGTKLKQKHVNHCYKC